MTKEGKKKEKKKRKKKGQGVVGVPLALRPEG